MADVAPIGLVVGMAAGDVFGLVVALLILGYLIYALFRGERL
jgi:K+-transporting ATPase KdpF subunit